MALKSDLQALITVGDTVKADVNKLSQLKETLTAIDSKGDSFDIYWRGVNDTEYRYTITKTALKTIIGNEISTIDGTLSTKDAAALLEAEIQKLGGK